MSHFYRSVGRVIFGLFPSAKMTRFSGTLDAAARNKDSLLQGGVTTAGAARGPGLPACKKWNRARIRRPRHEFAVVTHAAPSFG